jgi:hypothetical protein
MIAGLESLMLEMRDCCELLYLNNSVVDETVYYFFDPLSYLTYLNHNDL